MNIFVSYASEDRYVADQVNLILKNANHEVFFANETVRAASNFNDVITQALSECDLLIFLISPDSVAESSYALTELRIARDKWPDPGGHVLPVMVRPTDYDRIPPYLTTTVSVLEPEGNVPAEVAREVSTWNSVKKRVVRHVKRLVVPVMAVAIIVAAVILGRAIGNANVERVTSYKNLIDEGVKAGKAYVIPSATMIVRIDKDGDKLVSETRIVYQIYALKEITLKESKFNEKYESVSGETLLHRYGSEKEAPLSSTTATKQSFNCYFYMKAWEQRSIVTGGRSEYPLKLEARNGHVFNKLGDSEEEFRYNNEDRDFIGELVIMVESSTLSLRTGTNNAGSKPSIEADPKYVNTNVYPGSNQGSVAVARFKEPNDTLFGIRVSWECQANLVVVFKPDVTDTEFQEFRQNVFKILSAGKQEYRPDYCDVRSLQIEEHKALAIAFRSEITPEQRSDIMKQSESSPRVFRIAKDILPSSVKLNQ